MWLKIIKRVKWVIGKGNLAQFWINSWFFREGLLIHKVHSELPNNLRIVIVEDILDLAGSGAWKSLLAGYILRPQVRLLRLSYRPLILTMILLIRDMSSFGEFCSKSAYESLSQDC